MIIDILITIVVLIIAGYLIWFKFKSKPSDKYHNDSWKNRKK